MLTVWQSDVQGAVDKLLVLEKQARQVCHIFPFAKIQSNTSNIF